MPTFHRLFSPPVRRGRHLVCTVLDSLKPNPGGQRVLLAQPFKPSRGNSVSLQASRTADLIRRRRARVNSLTALLNHACERMTLSSGCAVSKNENGGERGFSLSRL